MKIAITGAGGGIGARLLLRLNDAGIPCCGLIRRLTPRLARQPGLDLRRVDFADSAGVARTLADCTAVIHAALDQTPASLDVMVANNLNLLPSLASACRLHRLRLVHLSSIAAIPLRITPKVIAQDDIFSSEPDWYIQTKAATEKWLRAHGSDLDLSLVRAGVVYGPYMNWTRVALEKLRKGTVVLPAEHSAPCYAIHVDDLCDLLQALAGPNKPTPRLIYGINPEPATWTDLFVGLAQVADLPQPAVSHRPLAALQAAALGPDVPSFARKMVRWLWLCPLLPMRLKFSRQLQTAISFARGGKAQPVDTPAPSAPSESRPLLWPNRPELETYLSTVRFTPSQTGASFGFACSRTLAVGLQDSLAWWNGELAPLLPDPFGNVDR